jgi:hypothetical protein
MTIKEFVCLLSDFEQMAWGVTARQLCSTSADIP